jgi:outer membrane receptor protein involved in Fe transport
MTKNLFTTSSIRFFMLAAVFCLALGISQSFAQSTVTGAIRGTVTDAQGAVVPNATVTITNTGTNQTQSATTDGDGGYRFSNLQPGVYSLKTTATGFAEFTQERVVVEVGQVTPIEVQLGLTGQTANVEVTAEAPVINTNDNANSININQTSINELPINGRRWSNFALLTPGTVPDGTFGLISFRGISGLLNNNTIDGGDNNQAFFSEERGRTRINYVISQAAIREFQVNTSNYSAEYGRSAGGVVNAVTKSGTNELHGELFYYNRNNRNGARNPRAFQTVLVNGVATTVAAKPIDLRQQYGGAIGGPIVKDSLFFFFSYDQQKRNFPGLSVISNPAYLNSANVAALNSRGITNAQINSTIGFINSLTGETPRKGDQTLILPKIDWHINNNNLFAISYNRLRWKSPAGVQTQAVNTLGRSSFGDDFVEVDSVNARLQSTFSANLLNEARFQYGRDFEYQTSQTPLPGEPTTAMTALGPRSPNVTLQFNGSNVFSFGTPTFLERGKYPDERRIQLADTVTYTRGRHTFKFGGDINRVTDDTENLRFQAGSYSYSNINDFIVDYLNYQSPFAPNTVTCPGATTRFAGRCYTGNFSQGLGNAGVKFATYDFNFFVQDDFRITPRLTLNLGLRYEYQKLPDPIYPNTSTPYSNVAIPNVGRTFAEATSTLPNDKNNFGPRIGFAYDLTGDGRTSLRGGYGIYYGRIINSTIYNALVNTGNVNGQFQVNTAVTTANAPVFPNVPTPSATAINSATTPPGTIQFFSSNFQAPLINQYDLVLERQLFRNTVVSVAYIGSLGRNLPTFIDYNFNAVPSSTVNYTLVGGPFGGQTFTFPRYTRAFGTQATTQIESTVKSEYNALVFQFNRRFTNGFQVQSSYTLARATDTNQNSATFTQNNSTLDPFNRSYDAGPSNLDVRHKFVVSAVWAPNLYNGSTNSFYNYLLNGWSIAPIYTFYSGRPFDPNVLSTTGGSTSLNGTNGDTRFPLLARNSYRLPNISNLDLRLSKRFRFTERYNLELLAEGFNVFNRTHIFGVTTGLYQQSPTSGLPLNSNCPLSTAANTVLCVNPNFESVTTTDSTNYRERQIQFAARFQF